MITRFHAILYRVVGCSVVFSMIITQIFLLPAVLCADDTATLSAPVAEDFTLFAEATAQINEMFEYFLRGSGDEVRAALHAVMLRAFDRHADFGMVIAETTLHAKAARAFNHDEERLFYLTQLCVEDGRYYLSKRDFYSDYDITEELAPYFLDCLEASDFQIKYFPEESFFVLIGCLVQNLAQHEYAKDKNWHCVHRVYFDDAGMHVELFSRGDSAYPEPYIVPGVAYSCNRLPWPDGLAPRDARIKGQTGVGVGVTKVFRVSRVLAATYWGHTENPPTITWDILDEGEYFVPGSRGRDHVVRVFIPLKKNRALPTSDLLIGKAA